MEKFYQTQTSAALHQEAVGVLVGGVASALHKSPHEQYPIYIDHGKGSRLYDIDGNEYMAVTDDALGTAGMIGMGSYNDIALFDDFVEGGGGTGMHNEMAGIGVRIYPNPATDALFVEADRRIQSLVITNIAGQECMVLNALENGVTEINTSALEPGVYFMTVRGFKGEQGTNRFIIR